MKKSHIATIGTLGLLALVYSGFVFYKHTQFPKRWKDLTPLVTPLVAQGSESFHTTFVAGYSEPHYLGLGFRKKAEQPEINLTIEKWNDSSMPNDTGPAGPDLQWKISTGNHVVASGGREPISEWIGHSIVLGTFKLKSGNTYDLDVQFGSNFRGYLNCSPVIEIGVERAAVSVELAIAKEIEAPISIGFAAVGALLSLVALGNAWVFSRSKSKNHA